MAEFIFGFLLVGILGLAAWTFWAAWGVARTLEKHAAWLRDETLTFPPVTDEQVKAAVERMRPLLHYGCLSDKTLEKLARAALGVGVAGD